MATLTLSAWRDFSWATDADVLVSNDARVYAVRVYKRLPPSVRGEKPRRCRKDQAASVSAFIGADWQGSMYFSLRDAAVFLAQLGLEPGDLENFFQAAADMGWEDDLILEARRAANQFITAPESPAYLVIYLLSGVLEYEYLPTLAEAQQAVADHCGVETTDLQSTAGIPWGAIFYAEGGDKYEAWAFPVHDSGENIADLGARVEVISRHRWQLWEAFHTAAARLRIHGLEVPAVQLPPGTGCPYCGSHRVEKHLATEYPFQVCQDCQLVSPAACPECGSQGITYTWTPDRSPTGFVRRQTVTWKCECGHTWNSDEDVDWDQEVAA
jgi:RNA polymerase subunit RPABC4/transcription elongation factor Spt4